MSVPSQVFGLVRQGARRAYASGGVQTADLNQGGDLLFSQGLPERAELARLGKSWSVQLKEANAFTALITVPSTLAELSLQNGESVNGGASYIIDRIWAKCVTSLAAANYLTLLAQLVAPGTALVADSANKTFTSLSGKSGYAGKAQVAVHSVLTGCLADKWQCIGPAGSLPTATTIAAMLEAHVYGRYVVPPGGSFNVNAQEAVSGGTLIVGVDYHECVLDLG